MLKWNEIALNALNKLIEIMCSELVLAIPNFEGILQQQATLRTRFRRGIRARHREERKETLDIFPNALQFRKRIIRPKRKNCSVLSWRLKTSH